ELPRTVDVDPIAGTVTATAAVPLPRLARAAVEAGIAGFAFLAGIPGNVGGGTAMNAGLGPGGPSLDSVVSWVEVLDPSTGGIHRLEPADLGFAYRHSSVAERGLLVTRVAFR